MHGWCVCEMKGRVLGCTQEPCAGQGSRMLVCVVVSGGPQCEWSGGVAAVCGPAVAACGQRGCVCSQLLGQGGGGHGSRRVPQPGHTRRRGASEDIQAFAMACRDVEPEGGSQVKKLGRQGACTSHRLVRWTLRMTMCLCCVGVMDCGVQAMTRMALGEALTNLVWAPLTSWGDIKVLTGLPNHYSQ